MTFISSNSNCAGFLQIRVLSPRALVLEEQNDVLLPVEFELLPYHREDTLNEFDRSTTIIENASLQDDVSDFFFNLILLKALAEFSGIFMFLPYLLPSPKDQDMSESIYSLIFKAKLRFRKSDHILIWMSKVWVGYLLWRISKRIDRHYFLLYPGFRNCLSQIDLHRCLQNDVPYSLPSHNWL